MNYRYRGAARLALAATILASGLGSVALAQSGELKLKNEVPVGRYVTLPGRVYSELARPALSSSSLQTWNGSYTYSGTNYTYNMVGADPSTGAPATIPVYIIPIKIVVGRTGSQKTFDPAHVLSNGNSVTTNTELSPIFDSSTTYTVGGVNVGTTQYIDAYQRANFWGAVKTHTGSHVLLGTPTVEPEQTFTVPTIYGKTGAPFGFTAGLVDINWFDAQLPNLIAKFGIQPNAFPIFLTYDVYLTQGGSCCIGGYHSSEGSVSNPQSYAHATYIDHNTFAQDVSALSHEVGEWVDDPLTVNYNGNNTPCGILEVGDPLENSANYGDYSYSLHGFTYHLQDLATMPYFGAPTSTLGDGKTYSTAVNGYYSFHNASLSVCSNGS